MDLTKTVPVNIDAANTSSTSNRENPDGVNLANYTWTEDRMGQLADFSSAETGNPLSFNSLRPVSDPRTPVDLISSNRFSNLNPSTASNTINQSDTRRHLTSQSDTRRHLTNQSDTRSRLTLTTFAGRSNSVGSDFRIDESNIRES